MTTKLFLSHRQLPVAAGRLRSPVGNRKDEHRHIRAREETKATKEQIKDLQKRLDVLNANVKGTGDVQK